MTATVTTLRRYTVGGSDAAAAAGIHPYTSPVMLWLEKTGRIDRPETEAMRWGTALQDVIALDVAERYDVTGGECELSDPDRPWLVGHPDGFLIDNHETCVAEYKTANAWAHRAGWADDVPVEYAAQAQLYMHLSGLRRCLIACLIGGQRLEERWVTRNDRAIELLLDACERFHGYLVRDVQPPADGHPATRDALVALYPESVPGRVYRLSKDEYETLESLRRLRAQRDVLDGQIAERENVLRAAMGDAETAISPYDTEVIRYRHHETRRLDTKRVQAERPDIYRDYATPTTQRRFILL